MASVIAEHPHGGAELTSFIGRRRELDRIRSALATGRLLTLTGPGGVGKSRLALRAMTALDSEDAFRVELAGVARPALVAQSVAAALDLRDDSGRWPVAMLVDRLRSRSALLVLDNCEHLLDACAVLADALLRACPELRILATSRQPLGIGGEVVLPVPPLSVPAAGADALAGALATSEAMRLFVDRARAAAPELTLDADSTAAIAELCRRLDGVPLALELAAVRLRGMTPGELLGVIDHRLHVLTGGSRTALPRHRTLRATIDSSYELLTEAESRLWRRLSVFPADFGLDAARAVTADDALPAAEVPAMLADLVDRSMVIRDGRRYRLLETLREYAHERLDASGEARELRRRHRDWYAALAARGAADWPSGGQRPAFDRLAAEHPNLRAALEHCLREPGQATAGSTLASDLWLYWQARGHIAEGRRWLGDLLERRPEADAVRARSLWVAGHLALAQRDVEAAQELLDASAALAEALGDAGTLAFARQYLGVAALFAGDLARAGALLESALALHREAGETLVAFPLADLAIVATLAGDAGRAAAYFAESLGVAEGSGDDWSRAHALWGSGLLAWRERRLDDAARLHREALAILRDLDERTGIALCVEALAWVAAGRQPLRAAHLFGAAEAVWQSVPATLPEPLRPQHEACEREARSALPDRDYAAARRRGAALTRDAAVASALEQPLAKPAGALTPREREVAQLVAAGQTDREVAERLVISVRTAETHLRNILAKLGLRSRTELAAAWKDEAGEVR